MNTTVLYLQSHPEIENIVLLMGKKSSINLIIDICRNSTIKNFSVVTYTEDDCKSIEKEYKYYLLLNEFHKPETFEIIQYSAWDTYASKVVFDALIFDDLDNVNILGKNKLIEYRTLIGICNKNNINTINIWEKYRKSCDRIYICSWTYGHSEEIMNWKRQKSDIELSVIFPMYNIAQYLEKCIETTTEWDAEYIEFLFVDDGSPDNCAEIVEQAAKKDSRIKLLRKENGGCASARQYGLERAQGRYIGFIDPDDYIDPSMFRKLLYRALTGSYEISYCGYKELYEDYGKVQEIEDVLGWPYCEGTSDRAKINELIAYRRIAIWRGIYLKDMLERNHIAFHTDIRRFDDLPFKVETLACAKSVVCVPEYLYYYRMSRPGQDVAANDERLYVHFPIFTYLDDFLLKTNDIEQLEYLEVVKIQTHKWAIKKIEPKYINEYCNRARKDLLCNYSYREALSILKDKTSKADVQFFKAIYYRQYWLLPFLGEKKHKNDKQMKMMKKIAQLDRKYY